MSKIYTAVQAVVTPDGFAYAHVGPDVAFVSNAKLTTHKRQLEDSLGVDLVNWSYKGGDLPAIGSKVYTIQRPVDTNTGRIYIGIGSDTWYASRKDATRALRALGQEGLRIYSFVLTDSVLREFTVELTATITATSQAEADQIAAELIARR